MWTIVNFFSIVHCVIDTGRLHFTGTQIRVYFSPLHVSWYVRWDARRWPGGILILVETKKRAHFFFFEGFAKIPRVHGDALVACVLHLPCMCEYSDTFFSFRIFRRILTVHTTMSHSGNYKEKKHFQMTKKWLKNVILLKIRIHLTVCDIRISVSRKKKFYFQSRTNVFLCYFYQLSLFCFFLVIVHC